MVSYRALLFDVMSTIVTEPFFEAVPASLGMTMSEMLPQLRRDNWVEFEKGLIDEPTFLSRFFADGRDFDHDALKRGMYETFDFIEGMEGLLKELKEAGCDLHLLSNYPIYYEMIEQKLRLSRFAPWTFVSCNTGVRKPDPEAYLGPVKHFAVEPEELLFIDDRKVNCDAALAVGLDAIVFESTAGLREQLVRRNVLPQV